MLVVGDGEDFQGVYDRSSKQVHLFVRGDRRKKIDANIVALDDSSLPEIIGKELFAKLMEDIDMLDGYQLFFFVYAICLFCCFDVLLFFS